jgi:hypothetical protein
LRRRDLGTETIDRRAGTYWEDTPALPEKQVEGQYRRGRPRVVHGVWKRQAARGVVWAGVGLGEELVEVVARQHKLPIGAHRKEELESRVIDAL